MTRPDPTSSGAAPENLGDHAGREADAPTNEMDVDHTSTSPVGPLATGLVMLAVGLVLLTQIFAIKADGLDPEGPRFIPMVVVCLWILLSVLYLAQQGLRLARKSGGLPAERFTHMPGAVALVVLLVIYAYILDPLGYWISTSLFFVGAARAMSSRNLVRDVVVGIGLSLLVYLTFTRALGVHLPEGVLGF